MSRKLRSLFSWKVDYNIAKRNFDFNKIWHVGRGR